MDSECNAYNEGPVFDLMCCCIVQETVVMLGQVADSLQALVAVLAATPVPLAVPLSPVNQRAKQVRLHPYVFGTYVFRI